MAGGIATKWKVLSGEDDWKDLLEPLDIDLRHYIIHCGERAGAVAVVHEPKSKNYRLPRYLKEHLFSKVGLQSGNPYKYAVKEYLYAAIHLPSSIGKSNFVGFVAVTTDEGARVLGRRDVLISWRGTQLEHEWVVDDDTALVSASDILGSNNGLDPLVHHGWLSYYTNKDILSPHNKLRSCRDQVLDALKKVLEEYKDEKISITVTGHSMGAAMATLNATDIVCNGHNKLTDQPDKLIPVTAIVFASPRLGDKGFEKVFSGLENLHVLRVTNDQDIVPTLPLNGEYVPVGKELRIDSLKSSYLKGTESDDFKLEVNRDLALVNKYIDLLKDEHKVVGSWWTEKNKSMIQMDDGSWVLDDGES
ncbi:hypothetical protein ABKV19_012818 [Rosa sericea]